MSAHTKARPTDFRIIIVRPNLEKEVSLPLEGIKEVEAIIEKYTKNKIKSIPWEVLAKDRIEKYKKSGLVLRGMRYREDLSQKELAKRSGINQNEISKIENGKRTVGLKVAKRLAEALNIDYRLLISANHKE